MARQALEGISKGEKSAQGIHKAHIEEIVRFLLKKMRWYDDGLDFGDETMGELLSTQHEDPSTVPNGTKDSITETNNQRTRSLHLSLMPYLPAKKGLKNVQVPTM